MKINNSQKANIQITYPDIPILVFTEKSLKKEKRYDEIEIVFFGTPDFSALVLEKLVNYTAPHSPLLESKNANLSKPIRLVVKSVVTTPDQVTGRKKMPAESPVAKVAQKHHIPVFKPEKLSEGFIMDHFSLLVCDIFVVAAYGKILPEELLEIPEFGALNIHPSLLPKYRGASPIQSAILNEDEVSGISIIKMDEKMDHGPIVYQEEFRLSNQDTFKSLHTKMFQRSAEALPEVIADYVSGKTKMQAQDDAKASYCAPIKKEDGYFDIDNPPSSENLNRMIRAYFPWPTAWTTWNGKIVKLLPPDLSLIPRNTSPFLVQIEGKRAVLLKDFLNGYPNFPIKSLG